MPSEGYLWFRARASDGFDGWLMLVREELETEDQAIVPEIRRLRVAGEAIWEALGERGVRLAELRLEYDCGFVYNPPDLGDEQAWALEHFGGRFVDYVASDDELLAALLRHQREVHGLEPAVAPRGAARHGYRAHSARAESVGAARTPTPEAAGTVGAEAEAGAEAGAGGQREADADRAPPLAAMTEHVAARRRPRVFGLDAGGSSDAEADADAHADDDDDAVAAAALQLGVCWPRVCGEGLVLSLDLGPDATSPAAGSDHEPLGGGVYAYTRGADAPPPPPACAFGAAPPSRSARRRDDGCLSPHLAGRSPPCFRADAPTSVAREGACPVLAPRALPASRAISVRTPSPVGPAGPGCASAPTPAGANGAPTSARDAPIAALADGGAADGPSRAAAEPGNASAAARGLGRWLPRVSHPIRGAAEAIVTQI